MIPVLIDNEVADTQAESKTLVISTAVTATPMPISGQRIRPLPSEGRRSMTWLRSGSPLPRTTRTTTMTARGTS